MTSAFGCVLLQKRNFHLLRCNGNWNYVNWSCDVIHCLMNLRLHCAALPLSFLILSDLIMPVCHAFPAQSVPAFSPEKRFFLFDPRKSAMDVTAKIATTPAAPASLLRKTDAAEMA